MRVGLIVLSAGLLLLLLFSGCLDQKNFFEAKMSCLDLTSYSSTSIPKCFSQEECVKEVRKNFFSFDKTLFSSNVQQKIVLYENQLALSWLYFNESLEKVKEINQACSSDDYSKLPFLADELNHFLLESFGESDNASLTSFSILLLEKTDLEKEKIDLVKEENLYDDFIKLNDNLNELSSPSSSSSDSYVSLYLFRANELKQEIRGLGLQENYVAEFSFLDLVDFYDGKLLKEVPNKKFYVPLLKEAFSSLISLFTNQNDLTQTVNSLRSMDSFALFSSFDGLAGTSSSASKEFSFILRDDFLHRRELNERTAELEEKIYSLLDSSSVKLEQLSSASFVSFDENFFSELYFLLGQEPSSSISTQKFSVSDISSFKSGTELELILLRKNFEDLKEKEFLQKISFGEKIFELKNIFNQSSLLNEKIDFFNSEIITGLKILCDSRIELISSSIKESSLKEDYFTKTSDLRNRLEFKLSSYAQTSSTEERLLPCKEIVSSFKEFQLASRDLNAFNKTLSFKLSGCINFLDSVFNSSSSIDLSDFVERYYSLKESLKSSEDISFLQKSCLRLKEDLEEGIFHSNSFLGELNKNFREVEELHSKLKTLSSFIPSSTSSISFFSERIDSLKEFFPDGRLDLGKGMNLLNELSSQILGLKKDLKEKISVLVADYMSENSSFQISAQEAEMNKEFSSAIKIHLKNPFFSVEGPLTLKFPLEKEFSLSELSFSSPNVLNARIEKNNLLVDLNSLPLGSTFIELKGMNSVVSFSEEKTILFISNSKAVFNNTLMVHSNGMIPRIKTELLLSDSLPVSDVFVLFKERSVDFSLSEGKISFFLENVSDKDKVELYYSLLSPVSLDFSLGSIKQFDENSFEYSFSLKVKNHLGIEINKISLLLPLDLNNSEIEETEFFDSAGKKVSCSFPSKDSISFSLDSLSPNQEQVFSLNLFLRNPEKYWNKVIQELKQELSLLSLSRNEQISSQAKNLLSELSSLEENFYFNSAGSIKNFSLLKEKSNELILKENSIKQTTLQFEELKQSISSKLDLLQKDLNELNYLGFSSYAGSLSELIYSSNSLLLEAEKLVNEKPEEALSLLFRAESLVSSRDSNSIPKIIEEEKNKALTSSSSLFSDPLLSSDSNFLSLKTKFYNLNEAISSSLMKKDFLQAKIQLDELNQTLEDANILQKNKNEERILSVKKLIDSLNEKINSRVPYLLDELDSVFSFPVPENYLLPITKKNLEKIRLQLNSLVPVSLKEKMNSFQGKESEAFLADNSFEEDLKKKLGEAEFIEKQLSTALQRIEEDASTFVSSAKEKVSLLKNPELYQTLSEAEKALKEKNYFKAIELSEKINSFSSKNFPIEVPLAVYPIALAAMLVAFVRFRKFYRKNNEKTRMQKLLRER